MPVNEFLDFCENDIGTNLLTQVQYAAAADRSLGNQPGIASSKLVNKALRQATFVTHGLAQYISDRNAADVLDNGDNAAFLTQVQNAFAQTNTVVAVTTTYNALVTDNTILCSGSAFTVNLYTAVGNKGRRLTIKKTDASFTNIITIDGVGSQTIDGTTTKTLNTQYEDYTIESDGANWSVITHNIPSVWTSFSAVLSGFGTVTNSSFRWRREGDSLCIRGNWNCGTVAATLASIALFSSLNIDNTKVTVNNLVSTDGGIIGQWSSGRANTYGFMVTATATDATLIYFGNAPSSSTMQVPSNGSVILATSDFAGVNLLVPIAGWGG